jgi:hypothetical protein
MRVRRRSAPPPRCECDFEVAADGAVDEPLTASDRTCFNHGRRRAGFDGLGATFRQSRGLMGDALAVESGSPAAYLTTRTSQGALCTTLALTDPRAKL